MILKKINRIPPYTCRLLARKDGKAMSNQMISDASGLSMSKVKRISWMTSWDSLTAIDIDRFSSACGVDLIKQRDVFMFIKNKKFSHIKKASGRLKQFLIKLMDYGILQQNRS